MNIKEFLNTYEDIHYTALGIVIGWILGSLFTITLMYMIL